MRVTSVDISNYQHAPGTTRHVATVCMNLTDRMVNLVCRLDLPECESRATCVRAFIGDAKRQLSRMPEFRAGRETLELADDLLNGPLPQLS